VSAAPLLDDPRLRRWPDVRRVGLFVALGLGLGALSGVVWWAVTDLPTYRVQQGGGAVTSERGLARYIASDASFVVCGAVVGLVVGTLAWRWFGRSGWLVVVLVAAVSAAAGLLCWTVGHQIEPGSFAVRLSAAHPGDLVRIDLTVRAKAALVVWPLFAVLPVLLGSSLGRDPEVDAYDQVDPAQ
jgi:MFS family permease